MTQTAATQVSQEDLERAQEILKEKHPNSENEFVFDTYYLRLGLLNRKYPEVFRYFDKRKSTNFSPTVPKPLRGIRLHTNTRDTEEWNELRDIIHEITKDEIPSFEVCSIHERPDWASSASKPEENQIRPTGYIYKETYGENCDECERLVSTNPEKILTEQILGPDDECRRAAVVQTYHEPEEGQIKATVIIDGKSVTTGYQATSPRVREFWDDATITGLGLKRYEDVKSRYGYDRNSATTPRWVENSTLKHVVLYELTVTDTRLSEQKP